VRDRRWDRRWDKREAGAVWVWIIVTLSGCLPPLT